MNFNGDVSIDKMFDIHDNQQVKVYNNSNKEDKKNLDLSTKVKERRSRRACRDSEDKGNIPFRASSTRRRGGLEGASRSGTTGEGFDMQEICMRLSQLKRRERCSCHKIRKMPMKN